MVDKNKKKYVIPEADILVFTDEDIITLSGNGQTLYWGHDDNTEES